MDKKRNDMMRTDKMRTAKPKPKPPMMGPGYAKGTNKRSSMMGTPRMGGVSSMYAKGTKCKGCGKSMSSCKC